MIKKIVMTGIVCLTICGCVYDKPRYHHATLRTENHMTVGGFADETYIWESWTPVTNKVERFN